MHDTVRAVFLAAVLVASLVGVAATPAAATQDDADCEFPLTETDLTGENVTLDEPAEEVVVLDAASAQTFWEIGAEDRVVGMPVADYTAYLEGSDERTDVMTGGQGETDSVDVETVVELDADLVIAPNFTPEEEIDQLREANQTVYQESFENSFEDIYAKTELYGHFVGECGAGEETADETRAEVDEITEAVADRDRPTAMYYFGGWTAGEGTFIGELLELAGAENAAAEAGISEYADVSNEVVLEQDPDWFVTPDDDGELDPDAEPFPETSAVQSDQVVVVDANLMNQAGPRVVDPLRELAEAFHPEAFDAGTETTAADDGSDGADDPTDGDGAGFGVAAAVGALLAAALLARRA